MVRSGHTQKLMESVDRFFDKLGTTNLEKDFICEENNSFVEYLNKRSSDMSGKITVEEYLIPYLYEKYNIEHNDDDQCINEIVKIIQHNVEEQELTGINFNILAEKIRDMDEEYFLYTFCLITDINLDEVQIFLTRVFQRKALDLYKPKEFLLYLILSGNRYDSTIPRYIAFNKIFAEYENLPEIMEKDRNKFKPQDTMQLGTASAYRSTKLLSVNDGEIYITVEGRNYLQWHKSQIISRSRTIKRIFEEQFNQMLQNYQHRICYAEPSETNYKERRPKQIRAAELTVRHRNENFIIPEGTPVGQIYSGKHDFETSKALIVEKHNAEDINIWPELVEEMPIRFINGNTTKKVRLTFGDEAWEVRHNIKKIRLSGASKAQVSCFNETSIKAGTRFIGNDAGNIIEVECTEDVDILYEWCVPTISINEANVNQSNRRFKTDCDLEVANDRLKSCIQSAKYKQYPPFIFDDKKGKGLGILFIKCKLNIMIPEGTIFHQEINGQTYDVKTIEELKTERFMESVIRANMIPNESAKFISTNGYTYYARRYAISKFDKNTEWAENVISIYNKESVTELADYPAKIRSNTQNELTKLFPKYMYNADQFNDFLNDFIENNREKMELKKVLMNGRWFQESIISETWKDDFNQYTDTEIRNKLMVLIYMNVCREIYDKKILDINERKDSFIQKVNDVMYKARLDTFYYRNPLDRLLMILLTGNNDYDDITDYATEYDKYKELQSIMERLDQKQDDYDHELEMKKDDMETIKKKFNHFFGSEDLLRVLYKIVLHSNENNNGEYE